MILRSRFQVVGRMRFLSHLDLLKMMEKALRRADIPMNFSQGFNPHPKISFGAAKPVGLASSGEYFDVELIEKMAPEEFRERLQKNYPEGMIVFETKEIEVGKPALMAIINGASYEVQLELVKEISPQELEAKINGLFAQKEIVVSRISPKRKKMFDIRPGIFAIDFVFTNPREIVLKLELQTGNQGNVRPQEVLEALDMGPFRQQEIKRLSLYILKDSGEKLLP